MKKISHLFLFPFLLFSCIKQEKSIQKLENIGSKDLITRVKTLIPIDTTILKEGNTLLGMVIEQKIYKNKIILKDSNHPFYSVFNTTTGQLIKEYSNKYVKNVVFPNISPNGISISGDTVYILYSWVNKIFVLTSEGLHLETIQLTYPNVNKLTSEKSKRFFEFDPIKKLFIVPSTYPSLGVSREKFNKSIIFSTFDIKGNYLRSFGKYPESYSKGGVLGDFRSVYDGQYIYNIFLNGYSKIQKYSLDGKLVQEYNNSNHKFNYKLNYFRGNFDPYNAPKNDRYTNFALDNSNNEQVFYMDYYLNTESAPKNRNERHLLKYNITKNTYSEHIIPDGINLVSADNGEIYMYTDNNQLHEILLIKYEIK